MVAVYVISYLVVCVIVSHMLEGEGQYVLPPWFASALTGAYGAI